MGNYFSQSQQAQEQPPVHLGDLQSYITKELANTTFQTKGSYAFDPHTHGGLYLTKDQISKAYQTAGSYALASSLAAYAPLVHQHSEYLLTSDFNQSAGGYALTSQLADYQTAGNYALASQLANYQAKGDYALESQLSNYQPKGDYALASHNHDNMYQAKGNYASEDFDAFSNGTDATFSANNWTLNANSSSWDPNIRGNPNRKGFAHTNAQNDADASAARADITVPPGMKSGFLIHLSWSNCRFFDIYGITANNKDVFIRRVHAFQNINTRNQNNVHDGVKIVAIPRVDRFTKIRIQGRRGRIHYMGMGWSKSGVVADNDPGLISGENVHIFGNQVLEFGRGVTKERDAGKIGYGTFDNGASLNIVGAGTASGNRQVRLWDNLTVDRNLTVSGNGINSGNLVRLNGSNTNTTNYNLISAGHGSGTAFEVKATGDTQIAGAANIGGNLNVSANGNLCIDNLCLSKTELQTIKNQSVQSVNGRYIRLSRATATATGPINLSKIQVFRPTGDNIANATTTRITASSILATYGVNKLIDNSLSSFIHTNNEANAWIELDLGSLNNISKITIFNRPDCCQTRTNGLVLTILDASRNVVYTSLPLTDKLGRTTYVDNENVGFSKFDFLPPNVNWIGS